MECAAFMQNTLPTVHSDMANWCARLDLELLKKNDKTVVARSRQDGPLTIQSPFYPEDDVCHLYLLHPPAGIVGGDLLRLNISVTGEGRAVVTTPGATKFYRSQGSFAEQYQNFNVEENSSLEYLPQETIYFPNARSRLSTTVHLSKDSVFCGWDIHCLGLPANERNLESGQVHILFSIFEEGKPLLHESMHVSEQKNGYQKAFLQGQPIFGNFIATGADEALLESIRKHLPNTTRGIWGATLLDHVLIVRYLGSSTNEAKELFLKAWQFSRPFVLGRESVQPRIWAT